MNKRIKELEPQCWEHNEFGLNFNYEKFAELIVKECISIVDEQKECLHEEQKYWHDRDYGYEMAVNDASKGIKQFFGVEE
jgi:hypothetical protein